MAPTESPSTAPPRANGTTRPYLVFMRIGANALHPQWLQREPDRNWDLFLSCYTPNPPHPEAIATSTGGYNKLTHFRECVQSGQIDLSAYRLVMLADDDLEILERRDRRLRAGEGFGEHLDVDAGKRAPVGEPPRHVLIVVEDRCAHRPAPVQVWRAAR